MRTAVLVGAGTAVPSLPRPRGDLSAATVAALSGAMPWDRVPRVEASSVEDSLLTVWIAHELHHRGFPDLQDAEWTPELIEVRMRIERELEARLRERAEGRLPASADPDVLLDFVREDDGPSLAAYVQRDATADQVRELLWYRSIYHLKEADPTAWTIPRLPGPSRAALAELQYDEYGAGRPERLHAGLFAEGMRACGLDTRENAAIDDVPVEVLEMNVVLTMFGLQRRLRGASVGHLVAFEASSSGPSRRMARGLRRLGFPEQMSAYYDEHVEADAVHEQTAARFIAGALVEAEPKLAEDVAFGVFTCLDQETRFAEAMFRRWGVEA
ncbi:iron-containing redox enzyme family protein [Aeromicrobium duanguangcaii]|uniref:Iron-containing redox enzyme family protein n=1 Tax=Aeromicrobium duanguangcaii TaxID=2968086 RepID=A0ABY5KBC0_9ACTN|nr:iron-containing redox enzyme family protein [Aeromicrobium duanguangcaii]MCD9154828.1 iron-containing redox enzyme family protein [Aeromicrobium duanguangcaii]UUI67759.1 iron-containing redox enzyme family protein [Aeromicrobium duanguangcaii]